MESSFRQNVRGGIEQHTLEELTSTLETVSLSNSSGRWICDLTSDGVFRVKEVRNCIDDIFIPSQVIDTRWVRGINVDSCVCPICSTGEDEINHILFRCDLVQQHGGIYGGLGTASFLREFFPDVTRSLIILFFVLSIGVIIVVVKFSHGRIG
nr:RNA-directed DNA polymerase, eukaryota [Tanacetum cinerariifolium]